ncbi:MAG: hypothetical protein U9N44_00330 [Chloroflexota bacterium]|nr:hypothetical protein [Chloroflexota bacterium]
MKNKGVLLVILGLILLVLALIYGFKTEEKVLIAEGDVYEYTVTYAENESIVDTSIYTMTVGGEVNISAYECYFIDLSIENEDLEKEGAYRTAMSANGSVSTSVVSGEMWIIKDTLDLSQKIPVSSVYGYETITTLTYTYNGSHGFPWEVGKTWTYDVDINSSSGVHWQVPKSAEITEIEEITVPAGDFSCYRIEHTTLGSTELGLIEWWSEDVGTFIKMVDYSNYVGTETRELDSYTLDR